MSNTLDPETFWDWKLVFSEPGGHRIFCDNRTGCYAICDSSGKLPHQAVDGVLRFDRDRPLVHADGKWSVPVLNPHDQPSVVVITEAIARWVIENLKLDLQVGGNLFHPGVRAAMIPRKDNVGDVSTSHITRKDARLLEQGLGVGYIGSYEHGFVVLTHDRSDHKTTAEQRSVGLSESYIELMHIAREQGYYYLMLDSDAPTVEGLDTFNW